MMEINDKIIVKNHYWIKNFGRKLHEIVKISKNHPNMEIKLTNDENRIIQRGKRHS